MSFISSNWGSSVSWNHDLIQYFSCCHWLLPVNKNERVVDVKNQNAEEIMTQVMRLRNSTGRKVVKLKTRHVTFNPSIQGTWSEDLKIWSSNYSFFTIDFLYSILLSCWYECRSDMSYLILLLMICCVHHLSVNFLLWECNLYSLAVLWPVDMFFIIMGFEQDMRQGVWFIMW